MNKQGGLAYTIFTGKPAGKLPQNGMRVFNTPLPPTVVKTASYPAFYRSSSFSPLRLLRGKIKTPWKLRESVSGV
jgi:hypothetical protein